MLSSASPAILVLLIASAPALAQVRWVQRFPATSPPPRGNHAMAHDAARNRVVLFGGAGQTTVFSDTWEWDGTNWSERFPAQTPAPRYDHAMAYDPLRGRIVLFGGITGIPGAPVGDTWEWDGASWVQLAPTSSPPRRSAAAMAWHAGSRRVVLFGGLGEVVNPLSDTWEWDGQSWQQRWPVAVPALRAAASLAPDPATGALMLFGGQQGQAVLNDTWSWDGLNWRAWSPGAPPPARSGAAMADYPLPGRMTLYGGWSGAGTLGDTWQWDGSSWSPALPSPTAPSARSGAALASRGTVRSMCLFGGSEPLQVAPHGDTWELDDGGCAPGGWGQPAGGLPCGCETEPRVGTSFCASFSFPPPQGSGQGLMLGAPGACLGVPFTILPPGVCGPTLLRLLPAFAVLVTGDPLRFCATLPSSPALIGQAFCLQGAAVEVGACLRATDAVQVVVYR